MESLWRKQTGEIVTGKWNVPGEGERDTHWDVIVVGAGMAGILTAYYLQEEGKRVLVLEAARVASGQTERTTAKITSQHDLKYAKLIKTLGRKKAQLYAQANEAAIKEYERLIREKGIECQFERLPAYLYTLREPEVLMEEAEAAVSLGINASFGTETALPFPVAGVVCFQNQAQFSPLEFVKHIAVELEIWEHTKVVKVKGNRVLAERTEWQETRGQREGASVRENGQAREIILSADNIVIATHYPLRNVPGCYFLRQHQERSYVLALSGVAGDKAEGHGKEETERKQLDGIYYGMDKDGHSFRLAGDVLLLGGGAHRTGENENGGMYRELKEAAERYFPKERYPKLEEIARWSAQDCMPHDGVPFIGRYSLFTPDLYVVTGFQKWGMTTSMIAAMILRDTLCGRKNPYARLFSPQRLYCRAGIRNLLKDVGMSVKGLTKGLLHRPKADETTLENGHGGIVTVDGVRYACYRDEEGRLHKISARCPHLGCELTWNPDEKSWDCPCHGSRFDVDGGLLDNPAKRHVDFL